MAGKKLPKDEDNADIQEAEIVEENAAADIAPAPVDELKTIENLININIEKIDKTKEEIKPVKEMLESLLDADLEYAELSLKAQEAAKEKTNKKKELISNTNGKEINEKLKVLKKDLKEAREALSQYLQEYQKRTGFNEYESPDGELRQIVFTVKLVRKPKVDWD